MFSYLKVDVRKSNCKINLAIIHENFERRKLMNSRMMQFRKDKIKKREYTHHDEPDRIPGTSKIRTYVSNSSLYSKESTLDKLMKRAALCRDKQEETTK